MAKLADYCSTLASGRAFRGFEHFYRLCRPATKANCCYLSMDNMCFAYVQDHLGGPKIVLQMWNLSTTTNSANGRPICVKVVLAVAAQQQRQW